MPIVNCLPSLKIVETRHQHRVEKVVNGAIIINGRIMVNDLIDVFDLILTAQLAPSLLLFINKLIIIKFKPINNLQAPA